MEVFSSFNTFFGASIMFDRGSQIELPYPTYTSLFHLESAAIQTRRVIVHRTRDLLEEPLTWQEFIRRPYTARSRWLLRAWDIDLREWRQFYLGTSPRFRAPGSIQLALYDPGAKRPHTWIGRLFEPTVRDRKRLIRLVHRWLENPNSGITLDELRVVALDLAVRAK